MHNVQRKIQMLIFKQNHHILKIFELLFEVMVGTLYINISCKILNSVTWDDLNINF